MQTVLGKLTLVTAHCDNGQPAQGTVSAEAETVNLKWPRKPVQGATENAAELTVRLATEAESAAGLTPTGLEPPGYPTPGACSCPWSQQQEPVAHLNWQIRKIGTGQYYDLWAVKVEGYKQIFAESEEMARQIASTRLIPKEDAPRIDYIATAAPDAEPTDGGKAT